LWIIQRTEKKYKLSHRKSKLWVVALGTSIFGILGTVFGKRLMVISHGVCTLFVIVVAAVGLILSSLAAAQVSYFQGLVIQIQVKSFINII
jgi:hypothetical protein